MLRSGYHPSNGDISGAIRDGSLSTNKESIVEKAMNNDGDTAF